MRLELLQLRKINTLISSNPCFIYVYYCFIYSFIWQIQTSKTT